MRNTLIAIAAIIMAPALASAQAGGGGGGGGGGGHGGGTAAGTGAQGGQTGAATSGGASTGGQSNNGGVTANSGAANPPTTAEERHHDSLVVKMRQQQGQTGASVQQQATAGTAPPTADTGSKARQGQDTTSNRATAQSDTTMRRDSSTVQGAAGGEVAPPHRGRARNMGLSTDQVKQLQQAINQNGCNAGPADGQFGRQTREGVQCIRQQKNITEKGLNPVLQALNLGFTASPSASSDSTSMGGHPRMHPDTTGTTSQQYPSPKKAQHGKGMHDSTTSSDTTRKSKSDTTHEP